MAVGKVVSVRFRPFIVPRLPGMVIRAAGKERGEGGGKKGEVRKYKRGGWRGGGK